MIVFHHPVLPTVLEWRTQTAATSIGDEQGPTGTTGRRLDIVAEGTTWMYSNVYDLDTERPLNWWRRGSSTTAAVEAR